MILPMVMGVLIIEHSQIHDNEVPKLFNRLKPPPAPP
jgi:hypothetical protein